MGQQFLGCLKINFESSQIAIVDADDPGSGVECNLELICRVHFHERTQFVRGRAFMQRPQPFGIDRGCNQQNRICIAGRRFQNLRFIYYKVLAQDG